MLKGRQNFMNQLQNAKNFGGWRRIVSGKENWGRWLADTGYLP